MYCGRLAPAVCVFVCELMVLIKYQLFQQLHPKVVLLLFLTRGWLIVFVVLSIPTLIVVCATVTILDTSVAAARSLPLAIF